LKSQSAQEEIDLAPAVVPGSNDAGEEEDKKPPPQSDKDTQKRPAKIQQGRMLAVASGHLNKAKTEQTEQKSIVTKKPPAASVVSKANKEEKALPSTRVIEEAKANSPSVHGKGKGKGLGSGKSLAHWLRSEPVISPRRPVPIRDDRKARVIQINDAEPLRSERMSRVLRMPSEGKIQKPSAGILRKTSEGIFQKQTEGILQMPSAGIVKRQSEGILKKSSAGMFQSPSEGNLRKPSAGVPSEGERVTHIQRLTIGARVQRMARAEHPVARKRPELEPREARRNRIEEETNEREEIKTKVLLKRLAKHYQCMGNFIRTKVEPTIFYLPAHHTSRTRKLLEESKDAIAQKVKGLEAQAAAVGRERDSDRSRSPRGRPGRR
jgi:hypothetical protein